MLPSALTPPDNARSLSPFAHRRERRERRYAGMACGPRLLFKAKSLSIPAIAQRPFDGPKGGASSAAGSPGDGFNHFIRQRGPGQALAKLGYQVGPARRRAGSDRQRTPGKRRLRRATISRRSGPTPPRGEMIQPKTHASCATVEHSHSRAVPITNDARERSHHVYRAPNAPRTPFRFSPSAAPTANS